MLFSLSTNSTSKRVTWQTNLPTDWLRGLFFTASLLTGVSQSDNWERRTTMSNERTKVRKYTGELVSQSLRVCSLRVATRSSSSRMSCMDMFSLGERMSLCVYYVKCTEMCSMCECMRVCSRFFFCLFFSFERENYALHPFCQERTWNLNSKKANTVLYLSMTELLVLEEF